MGKNLTILVGNRPEWRAKIVDALDKNHFHLLDVALNVETIELPEVDVILPFEISEYEALRNSSVALRKSLVPNEAHFHLANDKQVFNAWIRSTPFASCVPPMSSKPVRFPP